MSTDNRYVVHSINPVAKTGTWHGPYERRWIAESVARKQRKSGRLAYIVEVDKEVP